jgi:hypothetical protein
MPLLWGIAGAAGRRGDPYPNCGHKIDRTSNLRGVSCGTRASLSAVTVERRNLSIETGCVKMAAQRTLHISFKNSCSPPGGITPACFSRTPACIKPLPKACRATMRRSNRRKIRSQSEFSALAVPTFLPGIPETSAVGIIVARRGRAVRYRH